MKNKIQTIIRPICVYEVHAHLDQSKPTLLTVGCLRLRTSKDSKKLSMLKGRERYSKSLMTLEQAAPYLDMWVKLSISEQKFAIIARTKHTGFTKSSIAPEGYDSIPLLSHLESKHGFHRKRLVSGSRPFAGRPLVSSLYTPEIEREALEKANAIYREHPELIINPDPVKLDDWTSGKMTRDGGCIETKVKNGKVEAFYHIDSLGNKTSIELKDRGYKLDEIASVELPPNKFEVDLDGKTTPIYNQYADAISGDSKDEPGFIGGGNKLTQ